MGAGPSFCGLPKKSRKRVHLLLQRKKAGPGVVKSLPDLVLFKIFSKLDWKDQKTCRLICRRWENLLRVTRFTEDIIFLHYRPLNTAPDILKQMGKKLKRKKSRTICVTQPNLKFKTMRVSGMISSRIDKETKIALLDDRKLVKELYALKSTLQFVTRLEVETYLIPTRASNTNLTVATAVAEHVLDSKINLWNDLLSNFENIKELILSHTGDTQVMFYRSTDDEDCGLETESIDDLKIELPKLKNLEKLVYCVDHPSPNEFLLFLKLIQNTCDRLIHFQVQINYGTVWASEIARGILYPLLGEIIKKNTPTLETLVIGNRNVSEDEDIRNIYLQRRDWLEHFHGYDKNTIFENLMDEMLTNKWAEFGLNALLHLRLEFPHPILPTPKIQSVLKNFIDSLRNLKSFKLQPIIASKCVESPGYVPMPYINDAFKNSEQKIYPKVESDQVFFSEILEFQWWILRRNCQRSVVDLILKPKKEDEGARNIRWRNVCWDNLSFGSSMIVQHIQFLTQLLIFQHQLCRSQKFVTLNDSDLQLILKNGKFLRNLTLSCDLTQVTSFGFSGMRDEEFVCLTLRPVPKLDYFAKKSVGSFSIFDLKDLTRLVLTMLSGHYRVRTRVPSEIKAADLNFLMDYFTSSKQLDYLIIGFEGLYDSRGFN